jgi:hypothetical protein
MPPSTIECRIAKTDGIGQVKMDVVQKMRKTKANEGEKTEKHGKTKNGPMEKGSWSIDFSARRRESAAERRRSKLAKGE